MRFDQINQRLDEMLSGVRKIVRSRPVPTGEDIVAQLRAVDDFDLAVDSQHAVLIADRALHPDHPGVIADGNYLPFLHGHVHALFEKLYAIDCLDAAIRALKWYRSEGRFWYEGDSDVISFFAKAGSRPSFKSLAGWGTHGDVLQAICGILCDEQFCDQPRTPQRDASLRKAFALAFGEIDRGGD